MSHALILCADIAGQPLLARRVELLPEPDGAGGYPNADMLHTHVGVVYYVKHVRKKPRGSETTASLCQAQEMTGQQLARAGRELDEALSHRSTDAGAPQRSG